MANSRTYQGATRDEALARASAELGRPVGELDVLEVVSRRSVGDSSPFIEVRIRIPDVTRGLDEAALFEGFRKPVRSAPALTSSAKPVESAANEARSETADPARTPHDPSRRHAASDGIPAEQLAPKAEAFLADLLRHMRVEARLETDLDDDNVYIDIVAQGGVGGLLIGRQGQTLDALQYLVNRVVLPGAAARGRVYLDTEGYRARYRRKLEEMALKYRDEALRAGKPVTLEEFSSRDRWIIHQALLDDPQVTTRSVGEEPDRKLMIIPRR